MSLLSAKSCDVYRGIVYRTPEFYDYFMQSTAARYGSGGLPYRSRTCPSGVSGDHPMEHDSPTRALPHCDLGRPKISSKARSSCA